MFKKFATLCLVVALTQAVQLEADLEQSTAVTSSSSG